MCSSGQLQTWATKHLKVGAWYLECVATWTHPDEEEFRWLLEVSGDGGPHLAELPPSDEFLGLDDEARDKAIAKRDTADTKKANKVKKQVQDAADKAAKRLENAAVKASGKSGEKKKKKNKSSSAMEPQSGQGVPNTRILQGSQYLQLTQDVLVSRQVHNPISDPQSKELILNASLSSMYSHESEHGDFLPIFKDIMAFITKVLYFTSFVSRI
jgi:hypothetical protein